MIRPTLEEAKTLAKEGNYQVLPVSMELYSDFVTPIEVLRKLQNVSSHCYLLESIEDSQKWGRYHRVRDSVFRPDGRRSCDPGGKSAGIKNRRDN